MLVFHLQIIQKSNCLTSQTISHNNCIKVIPFSIETEISKLKDMVAKQEAKINHLEHELRRFQSKTLYINNSKYNVINV